MFLFTIYSIFRYKYNTDKSSQAINRFYYQLAFQDQKLPVKYLFHSPLMKPNEQSKRNEK